jgi:hypothetical protein
MNRTPVASSNVASIGYEPATTTLEIEFKDGSVYQYFDVPAAVHADLLPRLLIESQGAILGLWARP